MRLIGKETLTWRERQLVKGQ